MLLVRRLLVLLTALLATVTLTVQPASAAGDDYPWRTDTTWTADSWGFTKRQCVSFVAWRMYQRKTPINNRTQRWGSALYWDDAARRLGYGVSTRPGHGTVAQWNAGEGSAYYSPGSTRPNGTFRAGSYGHVAYVQGVYADGSVSVAQYNAGGTRAYSVMRVKAPRYIYIR